MTMTTSHFREVCDTLGRFASVRDKAPEPTDRIIVQSIGGNLKLVAGTDDRTVVAECGPSKGDDVVSLVSSRLLLTAGKAVKGKGGVWFEGDAKGATLKTEQGGEVKMPNVALDLPQFVRPPRQFDVEAHVPSGVWAKVSRAFDSIGGKSLGVGVMADGTAFLTSRTDHFWLRVRLGGSGEYDAEGATEWTTDREFIAALRGLENEGFVALGAGTTVVSSWPFLAAGPAYGGYDRLILPSDWDNQRRAYLWTQTKTLLDMLGPLTLDEYKRVIFDIDTHEDWKVSSWDHKASAVLGDGPGRLEQSSFASFSVGVDASLLSKALRVWPDKQVKLGFGPGRPVELMGSDDWTLMLAPVALQ